MAFGGGLDDNEEVMSEINMTPLVDVMLVLLIIFISMYFAFNSAREAFLSLITTRSRLLFAFPFPLKYIAVKILFPLYK